MKAASAMFGALAYGAGGLGFLATRRSVTSRWFRRLRKPSYEPPSWVFGPVWNVLYGLIAYAGHRVFARPASPRRSVALGLWGAQMALNAAWSPLFFGARRPRMALLDIAALDVTSAAFSIAAARVDRRASAAFAPYLAWLAFATTLNAAIVQKNDRAR